MFIKKSVEYKVWDTLSEIMLLYFLKLFRYNLIFQFQLLRTSLLFILFNRHIRHLDKFLHAFVRQNVMDYLYFLL